MLDYQLAEPRAQAPLQAEMFHQWTFVDGTVWTRFYRADAGYLLRFPDLADFQVSGDGRAVRCWPVPGVTHGTVQHLYLNQVMPLALGKQGKLVFHASAVEVGAAGVAFMGASGRGKSTLAASFATNGFRFLTDDGLVLELPDGECRVMPSHPSIRLWQDSQEALIGEGARLAPPVQFTSKARVLAGGDIVFCEQPRRLRRVYFLGEESPLEPQFERMGPAAVMIELVKHSFLLETEEREILATHFDELSSLANLPIYFRLDYPRRFEDLSQVRQAIVEHLHAGGEAA